MKEKFKITGMSCAVCAKTIESSLSVLEGVNTATVNLLAETLDITYDENILSSDDICNFVKKLGYGASHFVSQKDNNCNKNLVKLILTIIFGCLLMFFSMGPMFKISFLIEFSKLHNGLISGLVQLLLLIPIIVINFESYLKGIKLLIKAAPNMDSLITIGSLSAIFYSVYLLFDIILNENMHHHFYFETAGMILMIVKIGKYLESIAKKKTNDSIASLLNVLPQKAFVLVDGEYVEKDVSEIKVNDKVRVRNGERIPVDGKVINGITHVDESNLSGESKPILKSKGDMVFASTINIDQIIYIEVTTEVGNRLMDNIIEMVKEASTSKAPIERMADRISRIFVPIIILISIIVFTIWFIVSKNFETAMLTAVSVLVIACPCSLGLATPTSIMVGMGVGAKWGILIKDAEKLEILNRVSNVVFDKTGTLTKGIIKVENIEIKSLNKEDIYAMANSLEKLSTHPLAKAIIDETKNSKSLDVKDFEEKTGFGVNGIINNDRIYMGSPRYLEEITSIKVEYKQGYSVIYMFNENEILATFYLNDEIKDTSFELIDKLHKLNVKTTMLTGDNVSSANLIQEKLHLDQIYAEVLPIDKDNVIKDLKSNGDIVAMVGDGINDAIALTRADIGIAIGNGTDIAIDSADIVLVSENMNKIADAIHLSKMTLKNIKQNLFWALFYNMIAVSLASGLYYLIFNSQFNPMIGAIAMSLSSVFVVTNALRLNKVKPLTDYQKVEDIVEEAPLEESLIEFKYIVFVDGMMCEHCAGRVKDAFVKLGATSVNVDLKTKQVDVVFENELSDEQIIQKISEARYEVIKIVKL